MYILRWKWKIDSAELIHWVFHLSKYLWNISFLWCKSAPLYFLVTPDSKNLTLDMNFQINKRKNQRQRYSEYKLKNLIDQIVQPGNYCNSSFRVVGCPRGVLVKAMDCGIVVREFVLQSRYYVHFRANTLGKGMNPLISLQLWVNSRAD